MSAVQKYCLRKNISDTQQSIDPLREVVACLQFSFNLCTAHAFVFGQIHGVFPFEELDTFHRLSLAAKVAVSSSLLILWFPKGERQGNGTWATIKGDFDDVCDIYRTQCSLLCAIGLHEK